MRTGILLLVVMVTASCALRSARHRDEPVPVPAVESAEAQKQQRRERQKEQQREELEAVSRGAQPIIKDMLEAINTDDHERFLRHVNDAMRRMYSDPEKFAAENARRRERYGTAGARPLTQLKKQNPYFILSYLVKFSNLDTPVPVTLYLKKMKDGELRVALLQYHFSRVK